MTNNSKLEQNSIDLQNLLSVANALPEAFEPTYQEKTVTPTSSAQEVTPDEGYDALEKVTVEAVPTQEKTVSPSTSQRTVTPDSGKFLSEVTVEAMPVVDLAEPQIAITSTGLITASVEQEAGYVEDTTSYNVKQLTTQAAKTVTPTKSEQTAVASGVYTTGEVKVGAIPDEYIIPSGTKEITENGTYDVTQYASVNVDTPIEDLTELLDEQDQKIAELEELLENKAEATPTIESLEINQNGTYTAPNGVDGYSPVVVDVQPDLQEKSVTPSTSAQSVTPDSGYDGLSKVNVGAVSTQEKTATPSTSQQTVTPDNGKFLSKVTVNAIPTVTQATPSISVDSNGLITASATQSEGYVAAGTKSATKQLTTQAAKTVTPSKSSQTAVASGRYTTGAVTVAAIPSSYIQPSGTKSITTNGTHDVKSYASVSVNVSGGSGGADTCTVVVDVSGVKSSMGPVQLNKHVFLVYKNGKYDIEPGLGMGVEYTTILTITNVVCGSKFYIEYTNSISVTTHTLVSENISNAEFINSSALITGEAPTTANATGRIYFTIKDDGGIPEL